MNNLEIRPFTPVFGEPLAMQMLDLARLAFKMHGRHTRTDLAGIAPPESSYCFYVPSAEDPESLIGCGVLVEADTPPYDDGDELLDDMALTLLAVHPGYQNKGRGTLFLQALEQEARERGARKLYVEPTTQAQQFYLNRGYTHYRRTWFQNFLNNTTP